MRLLAFPNHRRPGPSRWLGIALVMGPLACGAPPPPPQPPIDAEQVALRLEANTRLEEATRIFFAWSMSERDGRFGGRGVARVEPPYRARLDLFLSSGETALRAALVDDDLRLPRGAPEGAVPPPALLWGALGVFRPGRDAALLEGRALGNGDVSLTYRLPDGFEVRYTVRAGRVLEVERTRGGQVVERLTVEPDAAARQPVEVTYRDLAAFRELRLERDRAERVEAYPPDIWELAP